MDVPPDNLVLFDGDCNLCNASVQFILRHDQREVFTFAPIQSEPGRRIFQAYGLNPDGAQSLLLLSNGRVWLRSDAALEIVRQFGGAWRLLGVLRLVPRGLRDWVYSLIARNRHRWFGRRATCLPPTEGARKRFLT